MYEYYGNKVLPVAFDVQKPSLVTERRDIAEKRRGLLRAAGGG